VDQRESGGRGGREHRTEKKRGVKKGRVGIGCEACSYFTQADATGREGQGRGGRGDRHREGGRREGEGASERDLVLRPSACDDQHHDNKEWASHSFRAGPQNSPAASPQYHSSSYPHTRTAHPQQPPPLLADPHRASSPLLPSLSPSPPPVLLGGPSCRGRPERQCEEEECCSKKPDVRAGKGGGAGRGECERM
jgi:hypothetical protein